MASRIVPEGGWGSRLKPERTPRRHNEKYLKFIRTQPCCICLSSNVEAAHIRIGSLEHFKEYTGMAQKPDDCWSLPLCNRHHREQHAVGNELKFWSRYHIDPFALAIVYMKKFGVLP